MQKFLSQKVRKLFSISIKTFLRGCLGVGKPNLHVESYPTGGGFNISYKR